MARHRQGALARWGELNPTELTEADHQADWPTVCTKAGLDTDVEKVPLVTSDSLVKVDHFAIRRVQDGKILGTVGARYHPLQNRDAFKWFAPCGSNPRKSP